MSHPVTRILCPIDFSEPSRAALRYAAAITTHLGAALTLLTVNDPLLTEAADMAGGSGRLAADAKSELEKFFRSAEAGVLYANRRSGATTGAWPGFQTFCGWKGSGVDGKGGLGPYTIPRYMREQSLTNMRRA